MVSHGGLAALVASVAYRRGWRFRLDYSVTGAGACAYAEDSGRPGRMLRLEHWFAVPPGEPPCGWLRWLFDRCRDVDRHEAMEWFRIGGTRPFYPAHGPDADLYAVRNPDVG